MASDIELDGFLFKNYYKWWVYQSSTDDNRNIRLGIAHLILKRDRLLAGRYRRTMRDLGFDLDFRSAYPKSKLKIMCSLNGFSYGDCEKYMRKVIENMNPIT